MNTLEFAITMAVVILGVVGVAAGIAAHAYFRVTRERREAEQFIADLRTKRRRKG